MRRLDESADGGELAALVAEEFEVALTETPTTGYRWNVLADGAPVCRLERDGFAAPETTPGAPGRHTWTFSVARAGTAVIELAYRRPFGAGKPARQFTLRVHAR